MLLLGIMFLLVVCGVEWTVLSGKVYIAIMDSHLIEIGKSDQLHAALDSVSLPWWWDLPLLVTSLYVIFLRGFMGIPEVRHRYLKAGEGLDNGKSIADSGSEKIPTQLAGLKEQIGALEQRVTDLTATSDRAKDELEKQFQNYKVEVAAKGSKASPAKVESAIANVASSNTDVRDKLVAALQGLEYGVLKKIVACQTIVER